MLKVVLDTNQFISGLIQPKGPSAQLFHAWRKSFYILITCREIIREFEQAIQYPHIIKKYKLPKKEIESTINLIQNESVVLHDIPDINVIKEDPDDNMVLACALEAKAQYIVSGDKHLLDLGKYQDTKIITARDFLKILDFKI